VGETSANNKKSPEELTYLLGNIFLYIVCLKQIFLGTTKFGVAQQNLGGALPPNTPRCHGPGCHYNN